MNLYAVTLFVHFIYLGARNCSLVLYFTASQPALKDPIYAKLGTGMLLSF
jgi:hypothetical protein